MYFKLIAAALTTSTWACQKGTHGVAKSRESFVRENGDYSQTSQYDLFKISVSCFCCCVVPTIELRNWVVDRLSHLSKHIADSKGASAVSEEREYKNLVARIFHFTKRTKGNDEWHFSDNYSADTVEKLKVLLPKSLVSEALQRPTTTPIPHTEALLYVRTNFSMAAAAATVFHSETNGTEGKRESDMGIDHAQPAVTAETVSVDRSQNGDLAYSRLGFGSRSFSESEEEHSLFDDELEPRFLKFREELEQYKRIFVSETAPIEERVAAYNRYQTMRADKDALTEEDGSDLDFWKTFSNPSPLADPPKQMSAVRPSINLSLQTVKILGSALLLNGNVFFVEKSLGKGSFGEVFQVQNASGQHFALKWVKLQKPDALRVFWREYSAQRFVCEQQISSCPKVFDLGVFFRDQGTVPCAAGILMEMVEGISGVALTYAQDIKNNHLSIAQIKALPPIARSDMTLFDRRAIGLIQSVLALHRANMVHCDLKPENIIFTEDNRAILLDFGIVFRSKSDTPGRKMGTPGYMGVEMFKDGISSENMARILAHQVGVVLLELYTGIRSLVLVDRTRRVSASEFETLFHEIHLYLLDRVDAPHKEIISGLIQGTLSVDNANQELALLLERQTPHPFCVPSAASEAASADDWG